MIIYGVALLAGCYMAGNLIGDVLGMALGVNANIGGVGFAMLLLFIVSIVYTVAALGCSAVIYRNLTAEPKPETMETVVEV